MSRKQNQLHVNPISGQVSAVPLESSTRWTVYLCCVWIHDEKKGVFECTESTININNSDSTHDVPVEAKVLHKTKKPHASFSIENAHKSHQHTTFLVCMRLANNILSPHSTNLTSNCEHRCCREGTSFKVPNTSKTQVRTDPTWTCNARHSRRKSAQIPLRCTHACTTPL